MKKYRKVKAVQWSLRNETLARTLEKIGIIEGWGSGFKRIFDLCDAQGIERPVFEEIGDMLRVNFYRNGYGENNTEPKQNITEQSKSSVKSSVKIVEMMKNDSKVTAEQIASELGLSLRAIEKQIKALRESGKIIRIDGTKGGHWEVVEK